MSTLARIQVKRDGEPNVLAGILKDSNVTAQVFACPADLEFIVEEGETLLIREATEADMEAVKGVALVTVMPEPKTE